MQAILNAQASQEEFVKDLFVSLGKVIYCLSETFHNNVLWFVKAVKTFAFSRYQHWYMQ